MANTKYITVDNLSAVMAGVGSLNDARFLKNADKGALATRDDVTKSQLGEDLKNELDSKANSATTLQGYGITDAYTKTSADDTFLKNADKGDLATKDEVSKTELSTALKNEIEAKADAATTLSGYGITNAYTKSEIDAKLSSVYKIKGSLSSSGLTASLLSAANEGNVYNITDDLTTTGDFVEGVNKTYPAGVNVVIVNTGDEETPVYKFDVLAGMVDLSGYATKTEVETATATDIQNIINGTYSD